MWNFGKSLFKIFSPIYWVISLGKYLINNWDEIKEKFSQIGNFLLNKISGVWESLKTNTAKAFDFVLSYVESIWDKIKNFFSGLGAKIKSLPGISLFFEESDSEDSKSEGENLKVDGRHKNGLSRVPFDGYIAELHKDERVLTAEENKNYSYQNSKTINNSTNNQSNYNSKNDKKYEIHIHIGNIASEMDWGKVGEIVVEAIEKKELENKIAGGLI